MTKDIESLLLRAYEHQQKGNFKLARAGYGSVLEIDPDNIHALNLLGVVHLNDNEYERAHSFLSQAAMINADDAQTQSNLGIACSGLGKIKESLEHFERALTLTPGHPGILNSLGAAHLELGEPIRAEPFLRRSLGISPNNAEAITNLARACVDLGRNEEALMLADKASRMAPSLAEPKVVAGDAWIKNCRFDEAIEAFNGALLLDPEHIDAGINLAIALKERGDFDEARKALNEAINKYPVSARAHYSLGLLEEQSGKRDSAELAYRAAIDRNPAYGAAWFQLSQLPDVEFSDCDRSDLASALSESQSSLEKAYMEFARGRLADQESDFVAAINHYQSGHLLIRSGANYDDSAAGRYFNQIITSSEGETKPQDVDHNYPASGEPTPILVVGMPRSGTTLIEQILASHSQIGGAGESSFLEDAVRRASRQIGREYPFNLGLLEGDKVRMIASEYRTRLAKVAPDKDFVVDKTPLNFQYLGLALELFPDARIVHCARDPVETCVSIFRLPFDRSQAYAHDLASLGQFYRRYDRLMKHWEDRLPRQLLKVELDQLIDDPENVIERMVQHVGVELEKSMFKFHETERVIKTPSTGQVRRPLYRPEESGAKRYGNALAPLLAALDDQKI
jgi:tetratricopeptide (TPR) repeat protein